MYILSVILHSNRFLNTLTLILPGVQSAGSLEKGFDLIQSVTVEGQAKDGPDAFGHDLYILCAETALQVLNVVVNNTIVIQCN